MDLALTGEDLYWFFSTVAQTLGAIVGVIGMLTVYKLQNVTTSMQQLVDVTFNQRSSIFGGEKALNQTPEDVITDFIEKYPTIDMTSNELKSNASLSVVYNAYRRILMSFYRYKKIRFRFFTIFLPPQLSAIFFSLVLLPFSRKLVITVGGRSLMLYLIFALLASLLISIIEMIRVLMKAEFNVDVKLKE